jgi:hypothetical protein
VRIIEHFGHLQEGGPDWFFILDGNQILHRHLRHDYRQAAFQVQDLLGDDGRLLATRYPVEQWQLQPETRCDVLSFVCCAT